MVVGGGDIWLTLIVTNKLLQGAESNAWGDVEAAIVQGANLVMLDCVGLAITVPHGQRVAAYRTAKHRY